jgi:hypothetical protein
MRKEVVALTLPDTWMIDPFVQISKGVEGNA